jgi:hypothetical protein
MKTLPLAAVAVLSFSSTAFAKHIPAYAHQQHFGARVSMRLPSLVRDTALRHTTDLAGPQIFVVTPPTRGKAVDKTPVQVLEPKRTVPNPTRDQLL